MQKNDAIDLLALGGKIVVEGSKLDTDSKETVKLGIDVGKELIKEITKTPEEKFNECAKKCCIQKITVDVYLFNSFYYLYFHIFGGDNVSFCNMVGINILSQSESQNFESFINDNGLVHLWHEDYCF